MADTTASRSGRRRAARLHGWLGLAIAVPLVIVTLLGLLLAFRPEIVALGIDESPPSANRLSAILAKADDPGEPILMIAHATPLRPGVYVATLASGSRLLLGSDGRWSEDRSLYSMFEAIRGIHSGRAFDTLGHVVVTLVAGAAMIALAVGVFAWTRSRNPVGRISFSGRAAALAWLRLHRTLGPWAAMPLAIILLSGLVMVWSVYLGQVVGAPAPAAELLAIGSGAAAGRPSIDIAQAAASAEAVHPGRDVLVILAPRGPADAFTIFTGNRRSLRTGEVEALRVDQFSGAPLARIERARLPLAGRIIHLDAVDVHNGRIFGGVGRLVAVAAGLGGLVLAIAGLARWWTRTRIVR